MANSVKSFRFTLILLLPLWLHGCGEQVEIIDLGPLETPEDHDTATAPKPSGPSPVKAPEEIASRYSSITLAVRRPGETEPRHLEIPLGGELVDGPGRLSARDYLPAFMISQGTITSEGLEEKNPAVYASWVEGDQQIFEGWLFRDYPNLNPPRVEGYLIQFLSAQ